MSEPTHSPLPWRLAGDCLILDADNDLVSSGGLFQNDKRLIVKAVNTHAALVEALQMLYDDTVDYITRNHLGGMDNHAMKAARAALAAAKGQP